MDLSIKPEAMAPVAISRLGLVKRFKMVLAIKPLMVHLARKYHAAGSAIPRSELQDWDKAFKGMYRRSATPIEKLIATSPEHVHYFVNAMPIDPNEKEKFVETGTLYCDHLCTITDASVLDPLVRAETNARRIAWVKATKYPNPSRTAKITTQDACATA